MKMIRNKVEAGSTPSLLIFLVGILVIGMALRARGATGAALLDLIPERLRGLPRPTLFVRELTQLAGFACPWLRDLARVAAARVLARAPLAGREACTASRGEAA